MSNRSVSNGGVRLFADPAPSPDEQTFQVDNTSAAYYTSVYYEQHKNQLQAIPPVGTRAHARYVRRTVARKLGAGP